MYSSLINGYGLANHNEYNVKRACFNLGIGRELYDYPMISVKLREDEFTKDGGRPKQTYNLKIKDWKWHAEFTDNKITFLAAKDEKGTVRFKWGTLKEVKPQEPVEVKKQEPVQELPQKEEGDALREMLSLEYKNVFGKAPHGRMSTERISEEIDAKMDELMSEMTADAPMAEVPEINIEVETEEEEEATTRLDMWYLSQIETFNDADDFVRWAKECVTELNTRGFSEESIEAFKQECNKHYGKIK